METTELIKTFQSEIGTREDGSPIKTFTVLHFLNKGQETFVKEKFSEAGREEFEQSQSVLDDLRSLLSDDEEVDASYDGEFLDGIYKDLISLPDDYLHLVNHRHKLFYSISGISWSLNNNQRTPNNNPPSKTVFGKLYEQRKIHRLLHDPFNTTEHHRPVCSISDKGLTIYTNEKFLVDSSKIDYIREPKEITLSNTSELPEVYHREIVDLAVKLFSRRTQKDG